ncbi:MAG: NAD(P)/FAD-dependent oxidoreductase [Opitutales bacterium]|nr:NAD(P)/FAD-dependent oxidoreductase [Opitutales bacterium]
MNAQTRSHEVIVIGAGAAGCFGAIRAAEAGARVTVLESGRMPLRKVKISGGGRCNVTHACFDPAQLIQNYPRGNKELRGPFHHFQPRDTVAWFQERGVDIKTEADGRMFPVSNTSATIIDCLLGEMNRLGVQVQYGVRLTDIRRTSDGQLELELADGNRMLTKACLLATGSLVQSSLPDTLQALGHRMVAPVPSLFSFKIPGPELKDLAGVSVPEATVRLPGSKMQQSGPMLITHTGLSGPAILKLSAWAARRLHESNYHFPVHIQWVPGSFDEIRQSFETMRREHPKKRVDNLGPLSVPKRLWQRFVDMAGAGSYIWSQLPAHCRDRLIELMYRQELQVQGKSTHKEEFVTCGGVSLKDVNFRTMESRRCPGLYFAGETLDLDGVTGGFNFQAAWTTGYLAGSAMAQ